MLGIVNQTLNASLNTLKGPILITGHSGFMGTWLTFILENLNIDAARQKALGVSDMFPTIKTSCDDHEGSGAVKVVQWDGKQWVAVSKNWITGDKALVRKLLEESSASYAKEKGITPACMK